MIFCIAMVPSKTQTLTLLMFFLHEILILLSSGWQMIFLPGHLSALAVKIHCHGFVFGRCAGHQKIVALQYWFCEHINENLRF